MQVENVVGLKLAFTLFFWWAVQPLFPVCFCVKLSNARKSLDKTPSYSNSKKTMHIRLMIVDDLHKSSRGLAVVHSTKTNMVRGLLQAIGDVRKGIQS